MARPEVRDVVIAPSHAQTFSIFPSFPFISLLVTGFLLIYLLIVTTSWVLTDSASMLKVEPGI